MPLPSPHNDFERDIDDLFQKSVQEVEVPFQEMGPNPRISLQGSPMVVKK